MPRVNSVTKCRKSPGTCTKCNEVINVGEPYVFWAFMVGGRGGPKIVRCGKPQCRPTRSDLTQSEFYSQLYAIQDSGFGCETLEELESARDEKAEELRNLGQEQQDKLDNMPDGLRDGDTGQLLQERADACEEVASELESIDVPSSASVLEDEPYNKEEHEGESKEEYEKRVLAEKLEEVKGELEEALGNISC